MIPRKRTPLSATQRAEVWRRWKAGESLHAIGRAVGKDHVVVHLLLKRHGGIAPTSRRRSQRVLTLAEREDISRGIASGCSPSLCGSILDPEKPWAFAPQRISYRSVLHRPHETTRLIRSWPGIGCFVFKPLRPVPVALATGTIVLWPRKEKAAKLSLVAACRCQVSA
jgi:hypothetical protein